MEKEKPFYDITKGAVKAELKRLLWEDELGIPKIHFTCRHSNQYNFSCGDCIQASTNTQNNDW